MHHATRTMAFVTEEESGVSVLPSKSKMLKIRVENAAFLIHVRQWQSIQDWWVEFVGRNKDEYREL